MSSVTKNGITMTFTGTGNETVPVTGEINEDIDKAVVFVVAVSSDLTRNVTVNQAGLRELLFDCDNDVLTDSDNITLKALKE